MAKSIISYDKDLPEIPGRCPWENLGSFLIKDKPVASALHVDDSGRRMSNLLPDHHVRE